MFYSPGEQCVVTMCSISQRIKIYWGGGPRSTFRSLCFIAAATHIDLGKKYFLLLNITPTHCVVRFISCPARRGAGYRAGGGGVLPYMPDTIISTKNTLSEREREKERKETVSTFVMPEKNT